MAKITLISYGKVFVKRIEKLTPSHVEISKTSVLFTVLLAKVLLPNELASPLIVLMGLAVLMLVSVKHKQSYLTMAWPLFALLVIGFHGVFSHETRHILRDVVFALSPIALSFIGFWMAGNKQMWPFFFKVVMVCGFIFAINHLMVFVETPELLSADLTDVREKAGNGSEGLVVLCLVLGIYQARFRQGNLFPKMLPQFIVLPVLLASFVLSYSRTESLELLLLLLSLWGWLSRVKLSTILGLITLFVAVSAIVVTTPADEEGTLRSKFARSFTEISVVNPQDEKDLNNNWRAFETYRVITSFSSSTAFEQVFGQGFGSLVDLGLVMNLGGEDFREIPVFHNGYAYILIKTGLLGLFCYALFYIYIVRLAVRYSYSVNTEQRVLARLLLGCVLSLMLMMYVVGGMAETSGSVFVLLLGYLVRRIGQLQLGDIRPVDCQPS